MSKQEHPYAWILRAIADGDEVQWQDRHGQWKYQAVETTLTEVADECYEPSRYRVKPKVIVINGVFVPVPMKEAPEVNTVVFIADPCNSNLFVEFHTGGGMLSKKKFDTGLCHSTEEAAVIHTKALLSFTS